MSSALDMSLDDIIKSNKKSGSGNAEGGAELPDLDLLADSPTASLIELLRIPPPLRLLKRRGSTTCLRIRVSGTQGQELFSEVGDLKRCSIHYDRSGRSKGTADVVFSRRADASAAVKRYNNVQLDGKPMKIEIVGTNIATPGVPPAANGTFGNSNGAPRGGQGRGGAMGRARGGSGRGFGRGRGRGRGHAEKVSAEDLDADLEKYHSEAMETN
ncbi:hypothetical protein GH714_013115 [Hevea brasiliensis]|uniref:RRM domain-containing protein n=1 Tax=Hevea brasiliensis TaxID=3981 RepID=A0A6A6LG44_HEVBR|nr:hypothetical protein GH714_013115 [Hevea brasiliensis]